MRISDCQQRLPLTQANHDGLKELSEATGKKLFHVGNEAIEQYLGDQRAELKAGKKMPKRK